METKTLDKEFLAREEAPENIELIGSDKSFLFDAEGNRYIDFLAGWCVGNIGWGNKAVKEAIRNFEGPDYVYPGFIYEPWAELAELLSEITPGNLTKSFRTTGGTESIEAAMQIAMLYTGRKKFLSVEGCYHGDSIAALSIGATEGKKELPNSLQHCLKLEPPLDMAAAKKLEALLKKKDIAAFIMEPIICNLGVLIPHADFMHEARGLCKKYGTLFVMDEVATGFGRTGKLFAAEHFEIEPDVLCLAKALSGGYAGIGAAITTEKIAKSVHAKMSMYSTFGWHPVSVAAAIANIRYIIRHKNDLLENTSEMGAFFHTRINLMEFRRKPKLRMLGLAIGIDVGSTSYVKKIKQRCLGEGLLIGEKDTTIVMFPALNISREIVEKGLDILEKCV
jgi:adenosylmethionine-8-amino-7-oxononanoate aminotransferase